MRDLQSSRRPWLPRVAKRRSLRARRVLSVVGETLLLGQGALLWTWMAARSLLLFTELSSRETEELGEVEGRHSGPHTEPCRGKRPCALCPSCSFAAQFIGESLTYCGTFRLCGSVIGRSVPRGMSLSVCCAVIGVRPAWGRAWLGDALRSVFPLPAILSVAEGRAEGGGELI